MHAQACIHLIEMSALSISAPKYEDEHPNCSVWLLTQPMGVAPPRAGARGRRVFPSFRHRLENFRHPFPIDPLLLSDHRLAWCRRSALSIDRSPWRLACCKAGCCHCSKHTYVCNNFVAVTADYYGDVLRLCIREEKHSIPCQHAQLVSMCSRAIQQSHHLPMSSAR